MTETPAPSLSRRTVLAGVGATTAGAVLASPLPSAEAASPYFVHGVASGDPHPRNLILWTRVTPTPSATPGSGKGRRVRVGWQVATDRRFRNVVSKGTFRTGPARDHTVKVLARGLAPATDYYYRFSYDGQHSRPGRTRTAPARGATPRNVRFGVVSCANLQAGWFSAYRHLSHRDDLDAILHLGDYLYEYGPGEYGYGMDETDIRPHVPAHEIVTRADYRQRHAQYKADPDLQRLHARYPFITTWDDHETTNDAWRGGAENHNEGEGDWAERKAIAHRVYDEWMPSRLGRTAKLGDGDRLFRRLQFGKLAELSMLDLRSYRSQQASSPASPDVDSPDRTITGGRQMRWLKGRLQSRKAQWKLVGNPVMISPVLVPPLPAAQREGIQELTGVPSVTGARADDGVPYNVDQWDGYTADRREILDLLSENEIEDVVFLTGDIHSAWACDLPVDAGTYPASASVGTEFVCTSVTSNNLDDITGADSTSVETGLMGLNRHIKYIDFDEHGYSVLDVTRKRVQMDYYVIGDRAEQSAGSTWSRSWATASGSQVVHEVEGPVAR